MTILPKFEVSRNVAIYDYYLSAIRDVISDQNEAFIREHCSLIPFIMNRFTEELEGSSDLEIADIYAKLVQELSECSVDYEDSEDPLALSICLIFRLQRRLFCEISQPALGRGR